MHTSFVIAAATVTLSACAPGRPAARPDRVDSRVALTILDQREVRWQQEEWGAMTAVLEGKEPFDAPKTFTFLVKFPPNFRIPLHSHLTTERFVVASGAVYFGHGDREDDAAARKVGQGAVVIVPAGLKHYGFTTDSEAILVVHGVGPHNAP